MEDTPPPDSPSPGLNKIDLTQLQGFSFGTQWTQDKSAGREARRDDRPFRTDGPDRREDRAGPERRDRRSFRKPAGDTQPASGDARPQRTGAPAGEGAQRHDRGEQQGGPRRDGPRGEGWGARGRPMDRGPYDSPYFNATFYPEDTSFATLAKTIRASCRTFELFEVAKTVIAKPDRFVVVVHRKPVNIPPGGTAPAINVPKQSPMAISVPDNIPFESEDAAIAHVLSNHLGLFFDVADVKVDPPKGNFQVVNKCGMTGELLGPPNYHLYSQIIQRHHAAKLPRVSFESFRARIESVRDPEAINQWIEKMRTATRYTFKSAPAKAAPQETGEPVPAAPAAGASPAANETTFVNVPESSAAPAPAAETAKPTEASPAAEPAAPAEAVSAAATPAADAVSFDSFDEARAHLLSKARDRVVRLVDGARFQGKILSTFPQGEIRRAVEGSLDRQRRFPLDTANALRGRLRREGFTIFKKGSKGISYVCAVKRRFRVSGQVFADSINALITFIETNPLVRAGDLPEKVLGIAPVATPKDSAPAEGSPPAPVATLSPADREKIQKLQGDLRWLVHEGYVTEFMDGSLYAAPPMVEARKKEIESSDHDPENFPQSQAPENPPPAASAAEPAPETAGSNGNPAEAQPAAVPAEDPAAVAAPDPDPVNPAPAG